MADLVNTVESTDWLKAFGVGQNGVVNIPAVEKLLGTGGGGYGQTGVQGGNDTVSAYPGLAALPTTPTIDQQLLSGGTLSAGQVHTLTTPASFGSPESMHGLKPWLPYILAGLGIVAVVAVIAMKGHR